MPCLPELGRVWLAGAGPIGKPGLTREVQQLLQTADILLVDALVPADVYQDFKGEIIHAGKRSGAHSMKQEEINQIMKDLALQGKNVLRLKGGDPFVFGRGMEEKRFLEQAGIPVSVHPGLSSPIAILEQANIPVTDRTVSSAFLVLNGHDCKDWETVKDFRGTLIFLMGRDRLKSIQTNLIRLGWDPQTKAAVVSTDPYGLVHLTIGTLASLEHASQDPAIIVFGEVVRFARELPVVGLTCSDSLYDKLSVPLRGLCQLARPLRPAFRYKTFDLDKALQTQWLAFTSQTGAAWFLQNLPDLRVLAGHKIACIGPATAQVFQKRGILPDLMAEPHTTAGLKTALSGKDVTTFREAGADHTLEQELHCSRVDLYETDWETANVDCDLAVFASAGAVKAWKAKKGDLPPKTIAISDVTARELDDPVLAKAISADGLAQAILEELQK